MILGLDLHGVIDSDVNKWTEKLLTMMKFKTPIYIISGPPEDDIREELKKHGLIEGIHFNKIFSIVDYLKGQDVKMWTDEKGRWWASDEDWWGCKAEICKQYNVTFMIDDKERYTPYFENIETKFILYNSEGANHEDIYKL